MYGMHIYDICKLFDQISEKLMVSDFAGFNYFKKNTKERQIKFHKPLFFSRSYDLFIIMK